MSLEKGLAGSESVIERIRECESDGLVGAADVRGRDVKIHLDRWEEANQILLALLMEDAGLDPVVVAAAIKTAWKDVAANVRLATSDKASSNPMMLHLRLQTFTGPWNDKARVREPQCHGLAYTRASTSAPKQNAASTVLRNASGL